MRSGMVQYHDDLTSMMVDIDSISQHPDNYNNGAVEEIMASIEMIGMYRPVIVARETNEILAGNHTWMACKQLGATQIPVVWFDGEVTDQMVALIADNRIAALARPDDSQLIAMLTDLESRDRLAGTGYEPRDIERMRSIAEKPLDTTELDRHVEKQAWPTLFITVPPETFAAFHDLTSEVEGGDRERLEFVMRSAGWRP